MDKIKFAQLINRLTIWGMRELAITEMQELSQLTTPTIVPTSVIDVNDLMNAVQHGRKIDAIKAYRTLTNAGLREAKDAVEKYWCNQPYVNA